jgi:hypothetical protein
MAKPAPLPPTKSKPPKSKGAPGPIAGAGLPVLAAAGYAGSFDGRIEVRKHEQKGSESIAPDSTSAA